MDHAGIRLLLLVGFGDVDDMHHRLALAVHPGAGECEVRPRALFQAHHVLIEADGVVELPGADVEMIEHTYAHAHAIHSLFREIIGWADPSTKPALSTKRSRCPPLRRGYGAPSPPSMKPARSGRRSKPQGKNMAKVAFLGLGVMGFPM